MQDGMFREKVQLLLDPYFDREFFTNLIYCIDRKKTVRELCEAIVQELNKTVTWPTDLDKSLVHLFFAYQASGQIRENYQWLPISNAIYGCALNRGDGQSLVKTEISSAQASRASTVPEFKSLIRRDTRGVESKTIAWSSLLFLLDNRTTRVSTIAALLEESLGGSDVLTFELLVRALEVSLAGGWKSNSIFMRRAFDRFWHSGAAPQIVSQGETMAKGSPIGFDAGPLKTLEAKSVEDLWMRISQNGAEAAWELLSQLALSGISYEQISTLLCHFRGRILFSMASDHWPRVTRSIVLADSLRGAGDLCTTLRQHLLAVNVLDLVQLSQLIGNPIPIRHTGEKILDGVSKNISKDRLILRLDDAVERGDRASALDLVAVILKDEGLSHSVSDRLLLMASKQDSWTFDLKTLPVALALTKTFQACVRLSIKGEAPADGIFGLLRFLCDQREFALTVVPKTGTYGNGLSLSQFDVSGGARIVDRFVFNQMRNAQRVKVWPSDN